MDIMELNVTEKDFAGAKKTAGKLRALVVEDNTYIQKVLLNVIDSCGHIAVISNDMECAREALSNNVYDMVLLDINPGDHELEFIEEIR